MKNLRWTIPTLALAALLAGGCLLVSGQFLVSYDLQTPLPITQTAIQHMDVNLNGVSAYKDHKSDLKDLADVAILGEFSNHGSTPMDVELWMTPALSEWETADQVVTDPSAVKVWGPLHLGVDETKKIGWDQSSALFKPGRAALVGQIKGDGIFTLYALGKTGSYSFVLSHGVLVAVLNAGK
jgi:hypothetical protein